MYSIRKSYVFLLAKALGMACNSAGNGDDSYEDSEFVDLLPVYECLAKFTEASGDFDLGLRAYENVHPAMLGVLGYAVMSCSTLGVALERLVHYYALISDGSLFRIELQSDCFKLVVVHASSSVPRAFIDSSACILLGIIRWLVPHHFIAPIGAEFVYPRPVQDKSLIELFGENIKFSSMQNALVFSKYVYNLPLITASTHLDRIHAEFLNTQVVASETRLFTSRMRRAIIESLELGIVPTVSTISKAMNVSRRALQYSLRNEGLSFSLVFSRIRQSLAHDYLINSDRSIKYISVSLGFKDQSSFYKASLRWFGKTPQSYRDQA